jgi:hypothetical protein
MLRVGTTTLEGTGVSNKNGSNRCRPEQGSPATFAFITRSVITTLLLCFLATAQVSPATEPNSTAQDEALRDAAGILLVVGASGAEKYGDQFDAWMEKWSEVARLSGIPLKLIGRGEKVIDDRVQLQTVIQNVSQQGDSPLWIVMIGHGTFTRGVAKFNLRGPDVSATELANWLEPLKRPVVIVNCASASGPFVNRLSGETRIIVTATKSGREDNYAVFGEYFAGAIASADSDLDHDDEVSVHEAFIRASAEVSQFYDAENRIITEHALIDDNGDGKGTPATMFRGTRANAKAKDGAELDGPIASRVTMSPAGNRLPLTPEEIRERASIEIELDTLRSNKQTLSEQAYDAKLEPLMLRLAKIYQAAEKRAERHLDDSNAAPEAEPEAPENQKPDDQ